jgi:aminoglycoside phosphotransferase (APT) family kinase protein
MTYHGTGEPGELMLRAAREFGVTIDDAAGPGDAHSGADVRRVRTHDGQSAYLKVTRADPGSRMLDAARRELRFYRDRAAVVPVRTPVLLDARDLDQGVALLLGAAGDQVPVTEWSSAAWSGLGRDLAGLHAVPLASGDRDRPDTLLEAMAAPDLAAITGFWGDVLPGLPGLLESADTLREELAAQPAVLVHGDCHTGNVLHSAGGLVFCDWQSAGAGRAASDLAMIAVRAAPSGARVPPALMSEYLGQRGAGVSQLERTLILEELAIFVFQWPTYAVHHGPAGRA